MNADRRESLRCTLQSLAESYAGTMRLLQESYSLLTEELGRDQLEHSNALIPPPGGSPIATGLVIDESRLSAVYRGQQCYLGNSLPFRLLSRLARRPGHYFSYEELLTDVWDGPRSPDAVRSVVKALRQKLRGDGLGDVAAAIESARGRYVLKLPS